MIAVQKNKLSIVAPFFNEEAVLGQFLEKTLAILNADFAHYELILIDDGSTDRSCAVCLPFIQANPSVRLLCFSRNYGHEIALTAGLDYVTGDQVILMDTDLQHPPELIPELVKKATEGYDVVCATRSNRNHQPWLKRMTARFFYYVSRKMTGLDIQSERGNYRLLNKVVVDSLRQMKESNRHLVMMFAYVGFKTAELPFECPPRPAGRSKYQLKELINLSLDSIIGFSARPLRLMSVFSLLISFVMMGYAGFVLVEKLFMHQALADGMASLIFLISGLFSILFLFLAVISEYISRILVESKNRPLYYIKKDITHDLFSRTD
jgi:glycosyltransferase involved in cell wall biosynthesis